MSARSEYTNSTVSSKNCSYNSLGHYSGANTAMAPLRGSSSQGNYYLTPNYSSIGYDTLTFPEDSNCRSYPTISQAYGNGSGSCNTTYTKRLCGGGATGPKK